MKHTILIAVFLIALTGFFVYRDHSIKQQGTSLGTQTKEAPIMGGVIPHHTLAGFLIDDFFTKLSYQKPTTIILIGPNHFERGEYPILTSTKQWDTEQGKVNANNILISQLIENNMVHEDNDVVSNEHAVASIAPFVAKHLPGSTIVPLILTGQMNLEQIQSLADSLSPFITDDTIVVASVDFSHYLKRDEAQANDLSTQKFLETNDYRSLINLDSAFADSPPSLITLMKLMEVKGAHMEIVAHTNSSIIRDDPYASTTSYFEIVYR